MKPDGARAWGLMALGTVLLLAVWELVGRMECAGRTWPPLSDVLAYLGPSEQRGLLTRSLNATATAAGSGFLLGAATALLLAVLGSLVPRLQPGFERMAALVNALPLIALAPLLITTVGRESTPAVVAGLGAGFTMFVAASSGLTATRSVHQDLFTALGAQRLRRLLLLQLPSSVPLLLDGLALAAPAAVLGAVVGEWFGADSGLGVLLVSSMQNLQTELMWVAGLATTLLSLALYVTISGLRALLIRRFV